MTGREWEKQKRECVYELEYFYRLLQFMEQEVVYRQTALGAALEHFLAYAKGKCAVFAALLMRMLETEQESVDILWRDAVGKVYGQSGLGREEIRILESSGNSFSLWQKEMIGEQSSLDRKCLWELWQRRNEQFQKDCRLFRCLTAAASLFVVILLI